MAQVQNGHLSVMYRSSSPKNEAQECRKVTDYCTAGLSHAAKFSFFEGKSDFVHFIFILMFTSFQLVIDLKKVQKQGRDERMQEDYLIFAKNTQQMCSSLLAFFSCQPCFCTFQAQP